MKETSVKWISPAEGVELPEPAWTEDAQKVLTPQALDLLASLHRALNPERLSLLSARQDRQAQFDNGAVPEYLDKSSEMVTGSWKVAPIPQDLLKRRVEITGPVNSAKMVINMLSRNDEGVRADCAMLDFEDSMKPSWDNVISGVLNVIGAARGDLRHVEPARGDKAEKIYALNPDDMPVVMVRARGLHLNESNLRIDGEPLSGGLMDLALCFFHSAAILLDRNRTPKYYIPKCEHYLEARWWNSLFSNVESTLGFDVPTLRATFLIETLPAAFQMEEILYEFREHAAGLNGGRWDKIFSDIKTLKTHADRIMADRASINMDRPWMSDYAKRIIEICHARGAFAMGGMSAFTPGKTPEVRDAQTAKVVADKTHEARIGHDGCWVSHPYFIDKALSAFTNDNQLERQSDLPDKYPDLLPQGTGPRTEEGVRTNVRVGIAYMRGWIEDIGCVSWDGLMEDLATLEISRAQVWQWLHHQVTLDDGTEVTREYLQRIFEEEYEKIKSEVGFSSDPLWEKARADAETLFLAEDFQEFLSLKSELVS